MMAYSKERLNGLFHFRFLVYYVSFLKHFFSESNISFIEIQDGIFSTLKHHFNETPSEVVFRGQRESNAIKVYITSPEQYTVCEVEAIGIFFFKFQ